VQTGRDVVEPRTATRWKQFFFLPPTTNGFKINQKKMQVLPAPDREPLVIDNGSYMIKAGVGGTDIPSTVLRNLISVARVVYDGKRAVRRIGEDVHHGIYWDRPRSAISVCTKFFKMVPCCDRS
jgi:hypothetical protein